MLLQILAVQGVIRALCNPSGSIFLAKGRADIGFKLNLFVAVLNTIVLFIAARHGLNIFAINFTALYFLYFPIILTLLNRVIGLKHRQYFKTLLGPASFTALMGVFTYLLYDVLRGGLSYLQLLIVLVVTGSVVYAALCLIFDREYIFGNLKVILKRN